MKLTNTSAGVLREPKRCERPYAVAPNQMCTFNLLVFSGNGCGEFKKPECQNGLPCKWNGPKPAVCPSCLMLSHTQITLHLGPFSRNKATPQTIDPIATQHGTQPPTTQQGKNRGRSASGNCLDHIKSSPIPSNSISSMQHWSQGLPGFMSRKKHKTKNMHTQQRGLAASDSSSICLSPQEANIFPVVIDSLETQQQEHRT